MEAGIFKKTLPVRVSALRKLNKEDPVFRSLFVFDNVPGSPATYHTHWFKRPHGRSAYGYYRNDRLVLLYTEGAGLFMTAGGQKRGAR